MLDAASLEAIAQEARNCFLNEDAPEYIEMLVNGLEELTIAFTASQEDTDLNSTYKELGRAAHSLKGGAGMAQMTAIQQLSHKLEDLFEALEQERIQDKDIALEFITNAVEKLEYLIELANTGESEDVSLEASKEIIGALEEYLSTLESFEDSLKLDNTSLDFIYTALAVDLEECIKRLETLISPSTTFEDLNKALMIFEEECSLLGQALGLPWLEECINVSKQVKELGKIPIHELAKITITEIRQLVIKFIDSQIGESPKVSDALLKLLPQSSSQESIGVTLQTSTSLDENISQNQEGQNLATQSQNSNYLRITIHRLNNMSNTVGELLINHERLLLSDNQLKQASINLKNKARQLNPLREEIEYFYDKFSIRNLILSDSDENKSEKFDPILMDNYTELHSTLQNFQELMMQVHEISEDIDFVSRELQETMAQMRQSLDTLDEDLTQSRLVPFGSVARYYVKPIEGYNRQYHKSVQLVIEGENVLVDQAVLEQLRNPFTHTIRNAFDHGIELPQEREALGKPMTGSIILAAVVKSNQVVITIADDGRGINLKKVYQKAINVGLCPKTSSFESLSQDQILDFIFTPGFSTADKVGNLSGRGRGMDIVKLEIEKLGGNIKVDTTPGLGTKFTIRIPLSLNIFSLLLVRCQQQVLAIPSEDIARIISLVEFPLENTSPPTIIWDDKSTPVIPLDQLLPYYVKGIFDQSSNFGNRHIGLVLKVNGKHLVVTVDSIVGEKELVVKPFDNTVPVPPYIGGCTILGSGQVVPILVPDYFEELLGDGVSLVEAGIKGNTTDISSAQSSTSQSSTSQSSQKKPISTEGISILAIDDSIAVRRTLNRVLTQSGYQVVQAKDGKEAWDILTQSNLHFDLAISDLEMPVMDGFALLKLIRSHQSWQDLPVIILTSRETQLHREKAMTLGANAYMTKPFHPIGILDTISSLLDNQ